MDALYLLIPVFAIFWPALILPGPDFVGVVRASMSKGPRIGLLTTVGVTLGQGIYCGLSLLGLAALLVEYQWLTWVVRLLGGGYLLYLGVRLILTKPAPMDEQDSRHLPVSGNPVLFGLTITLTNPKAVVLFASVFATTLDGHTPLWLQLLVIGLVMASCFIWYAMVALFMSSAPVINRFKSAQHWIERAAGVCFIGIGGRILADSRQPLTP